MNIRNFVAAASAALMLAPLAAKTLVDDEVNPNISVTFDDDLYASVFHAKSGSLQAQLYGTVFDGNYRKEFLFSSEGGLEQLSRFDLRFVGTAPYNAQLTISGWRLKGSVEAFNAVTGVSLERIDFDESSFERTADFLFPRVLPGKEDVRMVVAFDFMSGTHLLPSPDPACTSISCMQVVKATPNLTMDFYVMAVPEPQTASLLVAGMAMLTLYARRVRQRSREDVESLFSAIKNSQTAGANQLLPRSYQSQQT